MSNVKDQESFLKSVTAMATQKNANLFHCYVCGDIFKIITARKSREFDFSSFECDKEVITFIESAIDILRQNLPQQLLLFEKGCHSDF
jgi:adenylyl- and sulfurtransferase ThiI